MSLSIPTSGKFGDIKDFLYAWLGKQNKAPSYEISQQGTKQRIRFKCEVRFNCLTLLKFCLIYFFLQLSVPSFSYTAIGNSTNKKDAQTNAAIDFCQYLVC